MNLVPVLVTGLVAGGVSCAAVQGGLLAGLVMRQRPAGAPVGGGSRLEPAPAAARAAAAGRGWGGRLVDDVTPVGAFLAGKLVSHTLLGAVLGALGGVVQLSVGVRTMTQIAAGVIVVAFGLAQLRVPGFRSLVVEPPASWSRFVRGRARSSSAFAPAVLGLASVLVPCGVTLSVEALALASGSAVAGAATMAVFVVGTSPLFAVLGYAARRAAIAWRGRIAAVTGVVVVALGLYTLNGGLELAGSPLSASRLAQGLGLGPAPVTVAAAPQDAPPVSVGADGVQLVVVTAVTDAYRPANIAVRAAVQTRLVVRSQGAQGCVRAFVVPALGRQWILPVTGDTAIDLGDLPELSKAWERGVDELATDDAEVAEYVAALEQQEEETDLPEASGDAIAAEIQRYLRRRSAD